MCLGQLYSWNDKSDHGFDIIMVEEERYSPSAKREKRAPRQSIVKNTQSGEQNLISIQDTCAKQKYQANKVVLSGILTDSHNSTSALPSTLR